jgi:hypothetical protein
MQGPARTEVGGLLRHTQGRYFTPPIPYPYLIFIYLCSSQYTPCSYVHLYDKFLRISFTSCALLAKNIVSSSSAYSSISILLISIRSARLAAASIILSYASASFLLIVCKMVVYFFFCLGLVFFTVVFLSSTGVGSAGFSILASDRVVGFMPLRILVTSGAFFAK